MRAILFGLLQPGGKVTADEFEGPRAVQRARDLRTAVEGDFPEGVFTVWGDEEAREEYGKAYVEELLRG